MMLFDFASLRSERGYLPERTPNVARR